ncbi:hypothetical protein ABT095_18095 [Kitasatospora sp. NPDC002227]|uniref:hypothetical protein n=1 Tax=Kitasatospora sp. NPDC002227 TaxID=3154773 RepID=UPI003323B494
MLSAFSAITPGLLALAAIVRVIVRARMTRQIAREALADSDPKDRPEILRALPK